MPRKPDRLEKPRLNYIRERVRRADMTDGGSTSGTRQLAAQLPIGAEVLATQCRVLTPFTGNTSAVVTVGDGSDVDRYHTGTPSVFAAAASGVAMGVPSGTRYHAAAVRPTVTITGGSDFTAISAGELELVIAYVEF